MITSEMLFSYLIRKVVEQRSSLCIQCQRLFSSVAPAENLLSPTTNSRISPSQSDSSVSSDDFNETNENEWLWAYLRDRQIFTDLNEAQKRRVIELELQTLRESGERVPERIPDEKWSELSTTALLESRKTIYGYLFLRELHKKKRAANVAINDKRRIASAKKRSELLADGRVPSNYPGYASIYRHFGHHHEKLMREQKLLIPARLNDIIVIDCGFEQEHARERYLSNLVEQIQYLYADINKFHSPSFVYLCNLMKDGRLHFEFNRRSPLENLCFETTEVSYLDLFPKEKFIYLSPDSQNEMLEYDHDAIYIIGGIVDLSSKKPLTFGKAKRQQIRHQRLPIDRYVKFGSGSGKTLTIDQVFNILMTLKHTGNWHEAFKYIPNRKVAVRYTDVDEKKKHEYEKYSRWTGLGNVEHS
ncbi:unnamed protein product [Didymodactylos carnosus]|uniref:RNA (guanine-9-)-methyltransferase domain-containing protein 1 n=1 Tax=Didymodactylos carnosus TaxID=1234261 RepID=A0A813QII2_9BILA|nr:unnamed protein product [Didymodactylos carnosus]CAF0839681.1 unnamed protein product [Didymodactylos carnosus]CAF3549945.1 unnamed protein product [Didymodactylos carnosus]CAF3624571.1 unnamed protein product [Didymodactylos carnosus]